MMTLYRTKDGDRLDTICYQYYGETLRYVEAVLDVNPKLSQQPALLPAGIIITLPDFPELNQKTGDIRLWD